MAHEFYVAIEGAKQGKFKGESKRKARKDQIAGEDQNRKPGRQDDGRG